MEDNLKKHYYVTKPKWWNKNAPNFSYGAGFGFGRNKKKPNKQNDFLRVKHQKVGVSGEMKGLHLASHYLN